MEGKTVVVTGCNVGIGKETVLQIARMKARIIMACRNTEQASKARDEIAEESKNNQIIVMKLDLSSFQSIRDFAKEFLSKESRLDVLVHNAGYGNTFEKTLSADGIEMTMATNHFGPFLLTHLLIDILKKSAPSRIVVVASSWYQLASLNLDNLNPTGKLPQSWYLYYASKCANIMFTRELAKKLEGTQVTVNSLHPGLIDTGIWRNVNFLLKPGLFVINKLMFISVEEGAKTSVYLATSKDVDGVSGKYFNKCQEASLKSHVTDEERCRKLWEESLKMVKMDAMEPKI